MSVDSSVLAPGQEVTITVGAAHAGKRVSVWMYSDPVRLATGVLTATGAITVRIPADAPSGAHRIAVFDADGTLLGWTDIRVAGATAGLANTGADVPVTAIVLAFALMLAGGGASVLGRRRRRV